MTELEEVRKIANQLKKLYDELKIFSEKPNENLIRFFNRHGDIVAEIEVMEFRGNDGLPERFSVRFDIRNHMHFAIPIVENVDSLGWRDWQKCSPYVDLIFSLHGYPCESIFDL